MFEFIKFLVAKYKSNKEARRLSSLTYSRDRHKVYGLGSPLRTK